MLDDWEVPRVGAIESRERRSLVELPVPGRAGSLFQDLESDPVRLVLTGSLYGEEVRNEFLESLREKFRAGDPVTFVADIHTATEVEYVLIDDLWLRESGERPDQIAYFIALTESPPPPPPPDPLTGIDSDLLDQADGFLDAVTGALDVIDGLGSVPDVVDPTPPLTDAISGVTEATEGLGEALDPLRAIFGSED